MREGHTHYSLTLLLMAAGLVNASSAGAQETPSPPSASAAPEASSAPPAAASAPARDEAAAAPAAPPPPASGPPAPAAAQSGLPPAPEQPGAAPAQPAPPAATPPFTQPYAPAPAGGGVPPHLEDPIVISSRKRERATGFYAALSAFGVLGGSNSAYRFDNPRVDQDTPPTTRDESLSVTGVGYDLTALVGLSLDDLALGGAVSFTQFPNAKADYGDANEDQVFGDGYVDYRRPLWTLLVGPGMDYRPVAPLRLGGMGGVSVENLPEFEYRSRRQETIVGGGVDGWVGVEFPVTGRYRFSLLGKIGIRQYQTRDVEAASSVGDSETGAFIGVGMGLAYVTPSEQASPGDEP